jgi:hypothetical protein
MSGSWRTFFLIAALYDLVLGAAFFFLHGPLFEMLGISLPNNISYIHLTAAFVFVQGLGYWFVYQDPGANRPIVKIGVPYKFAFASLGFYYLAIGQLLHPIFLVFSVLDVLFLIGFVMFMRAVPDPEPQPAA